MPSAPATPNIIPADGGSVFDVLKKLSSSESQVALIRPNNPPLGIGGFLFDIVGDEMVELTTDTSDHYAEDNTPIQDQATLRPEKVTVQGFIGELILTANTTPVITPEPMPLKPNLPLRPQFAPGATQVLGILAAQSVQTRAAITIGQSLYGLYQQLTPQQLVQVPQTPNQPPRQRPNLTPKQSANQTKQQQVFGYFYQLWKGRQLFSVETPWGVYNDMILELGRFTQPEETKFRTDAFLTFKKMRFARQSSVQVGQIAGRAAFQRAPQTSIGTAATQPVTPAQSESVYHRFLNPNP